MIICDLHTHSTASDGKFSPKEVVKKAYDRGVKYLALTDHDTLSGIAEAKEEAEKLGLNFIPGIELSTTYKGETIHILGYFRGDDYKNPELNNYLEDIKKKRIERAHEIVRRLKKFNDIEIDVNEVLKNGKTTNPKPYIKGLSIIPAYKANEEYTVGNYKTLDVMRVRAGAGTNYRQKLVAELTKDGKKNATSKNEKAPACYKKGTVFTAKKITVNKDGSVWAKTPSGYVCIRDKVYIYCEKV